MNTNVTRLNAEIAALLKEDVATGRAHRVEIDDQPYDLHIEPVAEERQFDIWANHDPACLRGVFRRDADLSERAELEELERIIALIRAQRGQDRQGRLAST